jgi:hypothetical protein
MQIILFILLLVRRTVIERAIVAGTSLLGQAPYNNDAYALLKQEDEKDVQPFGISNRFGLLGDDGMDGSG